jgi:hypothetical protein
MTVNRLKNGQTLPLEIGGFDGGNQTRKTINHTFCKCIAKMAKLSQYCTPHGIVYS